MKKVFPVIFLAFLAFLFSGCFETNFNFKTEVNRNGSLTREVQISGRGADRFVMPSGPFWEVKTFETKGGELLLQDVQRHTHAKGRFNQASEIGSDFRFDTAKLVKNITPETREELVKELGIKEPFEKEISGQNQIQLNRRHTLFTTEYEYVETFHLKWLIPILLHDLKKEILRKQTVALSPSLPEPVAAAQIPAGASAPAVSLVPTAIEPALIAPEKLEAMAQEKLVKEILPKFQFHSEVTLPGRMIGSNARQIQGRTAVWDFRASDFDKNYSSYEIRVVSKTPNVGVISGASAVLLILIWVIAFFRRKVTGAK